MNLIKTNEQIEKITKSCQILAKVKQIVWDFIRPGVSLKEIDQLAFKEIIKHGAKPAFLGLYGFPATACISVNEQLIHGIPSDYVVKDGDLVSVDLGCIYQGFNSDSAFTKAIGNVSENDRKLIAVAEGAFWAGVKAIKKGARVGDISYAIGQYIYKNNLYTPDEFSGHGIGLELHEDPYVPNVGKKGTGPLLRDGMVICIEPMIIQCPNIKILKDGWTVISANKTNTAHYEHTVLIKDGKGIVLTKGI
ncbi:type I methionyl aminopeptidase [Mycoplasmopsis cynos]|uniref:Methionine aminopeptidase n=2 Tax=Mycoplasmopsis cynos TaxID=171284 RepID=L0RW44_MYCC1|nr:type I methionyl aminopeptidase [Mycoplasmopsis cynos]TQC55067.1 type I methionyl aminopeptidase [Mycoplasmopsis cynos]WQQ15214.1 type I methionyl aminopeptidase [Mycoplasmopsis cynos]WQQ16242.1 type I methionyl aminopeptidase [Mycoplasmopsis cynos]WQQ17020.1 type I methionyl aminopeptidase [Mycoplasmopsis cynos]WQQ17697.1 type I methionyl aminopeptidase [Mycoplasmopsis cynos]